MKRFGRQPRNQAELLADLSTGSTGPSLPPPAQAPAIPFLTQPVVDAVLVVRQLVPVVVGSTITPILGRTTAAASIPGFKTIPAEGFPTPSPSTTSRTSSTARPTTTPLQQLQPAISSQATASSSPSPSNVSVTSIIPAPSASSSITSSAGAAIPVETGGATSTPAPEVTQTNNSQQIGILAGSIVGAMIVAALIAFLCIMKRKKAKNSSQAEASPAFNKNEKPNSLSGPISYPVQRSNSSPWAPPLRRQNDAARATSMANTAWPMGQSDYRDSTGNDSLDDKQYIAYQNLVGDASNQIPPPVVPRPIRQQSLAGSIYERRHLSASSVDPYEQINGRYSEWPPVPSVPSGNGVRNQSPAPYPLSPPPVPQPQGGRTMDQFSQAAQINQHYYPAERQILSPSYQHPGAAIPYPSPLFFKLDKQGNMGPESTR